METGRELWLNMTGGHLRGPKRVRLSGYTVIALLSIAWLSTVSLKDVEAQAPDLLLTVSPPRMHIGQNDVGFYSVRVFSLNSFTATISFEVRDLVLPAGFLQESLIGVFEPQAVSLPANAYGYSRFRVIWTAPEVISQRFQPIEFTVVARGGGIEKSTKATVVLTPDARDLIVNLNPESHIVSPGTVTTVTSTITVQIRPSAVGLQRFFAQAVPVFFSMNDEPFGVSTLFQPQAVTLDIGIPATSTATLRITPAFLPQTGEYDLAISVNLGGAETPSGVTDIGALSLSFTKSVILRLLINPDFSIQPQPGTVTVRTGETASYTLELRSVAGAFASLVSLSTSGVPSDASSSFAVQALSPPAGGVVRTTLTISTSILLEPKAYPITVTGTSGTLSRSTTLSLTVTTQGDYSMLVKPAFMRIGPGETRSVSLNIEFSNGYTSRVKFVAGDLPPGLTARINPETLTPGGTGGLLKSAASLSLTASRDVRLGQFIILILGASGDVSRTATLDLSIRTGCLIATSTFGSEVSPEVEYLRSVRDFGILNTMLGSHFMSGFNDWYYSFSPVIAGLIDENGWIKSPTRLVIYPLIGILHLSTSVFNAVSTVNFEVAATSAGLAASGLIGIVYLAPIAILIWYAAGKRQSISRKHLLGLLIVVGGTILFAATGGFSGYVTLVRISLISLVVLSASLTALVTQKIFTSIFLKRLNEVDRRH